VAVSESAALCRGGFKKHGSPARMQKAGGPGLAGKGPGGYKPRSAASGLGLGQTGPCPEPPDPAKEKQCAGIPRRVYAVGRFGAKIETRGKMPPSGDSKTEMLEKTA